MALEPARGSGKEGTANFFGRVYLRPGRTYAVRYAVKDGPRDEIFVQERPRRRARISAAGSPASSIVPAERVRPRGRPAPASSRSARRKSSRRRGQSSAGASFSASTCRCMTPPSPRDVVGLAWTSCSASTGRSTARGSATASRAPCAGAVGASMGLALPIGDWPTGPYRVVVELHDRVSDARTTTEGSFSIVAE